MAINHREFRSKRADPAILAKSLRTGSPQLKSPEEE
jgi:hypothetical protein